MAEEKDTEKSFWTTVPGILTGLAALVTAVGGVLVAMDKSPKGKPSGSPPPASISTTGDNSPVVDGTEGDVTIKIEQ